MKPNAGLYRFILFHNLLSPLYDGNLCLYELDQNICSVTRVLTALISCHYVMDYGVWMKRKTEKLQVSLARSSSHSHFKKIKSSFLWAFILFFNIIFIKRLLILKTI